MRCYRCISILIILPVVRWCSLIGPHKSAVVLFDRGYPSFGNVDSAIPIDVVRMKSYMDSLFDPTCVSVGVTINNLNLTPNRNMPPFLYRAQKPQRSEYEKTVCLCQGKPK